MLYVDDRQFAYAATAMRRASNRIPKRSLDTDFELTQAISNPKGRAAARRGPIGPSKARKATFTTTGAIMPQSEGTSCTHLASLHVTQFL